MKDEAPTDSGSVREFQAETRGKKGFEAAPPVLEDLLAGVTPENLHGEVDTGPAVGREVWG